jgi:hypothetical protein
MGKIGTQTDFDELIKLGFEFTTRGVREFTMEHAAWIAAGSNSRVGNFCLDDIPISEDMFIRSEISSDESYLVGGIRLDTVTGPQQAQITKTKIGLYQISRPMEQWALDTLQMLIDEKKRKLNCSLLPQDVARIARHDTTWVKDDHALFERAFLESKSMSPIEYFLIITADKKLCRRIANQTQRKVYMLKPELIAPYVNMEELILPGGGVNPIPIHRLFSERFKALLGSHAMVDLGSYQAGTQYMRPERGTVFNYFPYAIEGSDGEREVCYRVTPCNALNIERKLKLIEPVSLKRPGKEAKTSSLTMRSLREALPTRVGSYNPVIGRRIPDRPR